MRTWILASAGVLAMVSSPAAARNGAWYVGGDFGGMIVEDTDFDFGGGSDSLLRLDHNTGLDGGLFVGYDLGAFRLEAEVAYKTARIDKFENDFFLPNSSGSLHPPGKHDARGRNSALSFMINGMLDFGDDDGISGFVGGGAGIARVDYNNVRAFVNDGEFLDDSDTRFAWQVVAGLRHAISDNIDVTVKYRFFNVQSVQATFFDGSDAKSHFRSHSLLGGITFNFGAPPPRPPPVPPQ